MKKIKRLFKLLLVDDTQMIRDLLTLYIQQMGYEADTAENGEIALKLLRQNEYDLVLLDIMMPGISGIDVLKAIKEDPQLVHIPVLMLSSVSEIDIVVQCIELGADDHLTKPAHGALLNARIKVLLEKKAMYDREQLYLQQIEQEKMRADMLLKAVIPIGAALSDERDYNQLLKRILSEARQLTSASAGTLYWLNGELLEFVLVNNAVEGRWIGGPDGEPMTFLPLPLYLDGVPNHGNVAVNAALTGESINRFGREAAVDQGRIIEDTVENISFLVIPLKNSKQEVLGVLQLLDAQDKSGQTIPFTPYMQQLIESFSTLAVIALESYLREQKLRSELKSLEIKIDNFSRAQEVESITGDEAFDRIREQAESMRQSRRNRSK